MGKRASIGLRAQTRAHKLGVNTPRQNPPRTRADCEHACRPCPFVACKYHLFLHVTRAGGIEFPFGADPTALLPMPETCALDVADLGGVTTRVIAQLFNQTPSAAWLREQVIHKNLAATLAHLHQAPCK